MNILKGNKASQFVAWLSVVKGFLPKSMSIEEASEIFLRRCADEENRIVRDDGINKASKGVC